MLITLTFLGVFKNIHSVVEYKIDTNTQVNTSRRPIDNATLHTANIVEGSGRGVYGDQTTVTVEIQEGGFVIGEKSESGWGMTCAQFGQKLNTSCYYDPEQAPIADIYRKNPFDLIDGYAYLRLNHQKSINTSELFLYF